jgi:hypothetical protein
LAPPTHRRLRHPQLLRHPRVVESGRTREHDPRASRECGAVRARCAIDSSTCVSISVTTNAAFGRAIFCLRSR